MVLRGDGTGGLAGGVEGGAAEAAAGAITIVAAAEAEAASSPSFSLKHADDDASKALPKYL